MHSGKVADIARACFRLALPGLAALLLCSCRLVISTDKTGYIVSASGSYDCDQSACEIPVTEPVSDTLTAIPAAGYRFVKWTGICGHAVTNKCEMLLIPLPAEFREFDGDVTLSAIFEPSTVNRAWYRDADRDNYGAANISKMAFEQPAGFVGNNADCDDNNAATYPRAKEQADGQDNDCDGVVDEGFATTRFYRDRDGDGYGDKSTSRVELHKPAGYVSNYLDCNDQRAEDNPAAEEVVDNRDNDCDGAIDEGVKNFYPDVDRDGYGARTGLIRSISSVSGYVQNKTDCDDSNDRIYPGATELFDSVDNDCDGAVDEGFATTRYYRDVDGDGFGDAANSVLDVAAPAGYVANGSDNCVYASNPGQQDSDLDGIGDACDPVDDSEVPSQPPVAQPGGCSLTDEEQSMLNAVNAARAQARVCGAYGSFPAVPALAWSCKLETAAMGHSMDMANNNFFSHTGSDGQSVGYRATQAGYVWSTVGENIAAGYSTVSAVMQGWLGSDGHCANIMRANYSELGAAKVSNSSSTYNVYWTQVFGRSP
jgi:uncharacterized protein YkwD